MKKKAYLLLEFFLLFVLLPISFTFPYSLWIKAGLTLIGFIYIIIILKKEETISFTIKKGINWKLFRKRFLITFLGVVIVTTVFILVTSPESLFFVPMHHPVQFSIILLVYTLLSVWPQEIIYRTFFFQRYAAFFENKKLFIFINAVLFSLAHLFFRNTLVIILTFVGGVLFGITYLKFRSTAVVSIEHAIYGNWLFTVGMGQMLGFPGMDGP